ncbi:MAG: hypothetical protein AB7K63_01800 [Vicinamibacterales bacterium]
MFPELSDSTLTFVRAGYGVLMVLTLLQALPEARRFFVSERWGGYAKSGAAVDAIQNPWVMPLMLAAWMAAAAALALDLAPVWSALVNLAICRYFFIHMRWRGVLRGMGAPGFIAYWLGLAIFLLEYTGRFAPALRPLSLLVIQADLAFIMLSAGIYKATAGYPRNQGMELGLANPMWGYWWRRYSRVRPGHPVFWTLNQLAWSTEVAGGLLMLLPWTREAGGLVISLSFIFILTQIRLGFLCEMVVLAGLLYLTPGSPVDSWIASVTGPVAVATATSSPSVAVVNAVLALALWAYLLLLPLAHAGLFYNFYARRALPGPLQAPLERYTNLFGIIIWRVFSVDLVNFFIRIHVEPRDGGARVAASRLGSWPRFNHVGEMICLTSLFTTMKYYPGNDALFRERLLRYARTIPHPAGAVLVFEYCRVLKLPTRFEWAAAAEYRVDVVAGTVGEHLHDPDFSARAPHAVSPVHEGGVPGSYAPARR